MKIRQEQVRQLEQARSAAAEDVLVRHFRAKLPDRCRALGEARLREGIAAGIERAASYELPMGSTAQLITWMFLLGSELDRDPALARVASSLREPPYWSPERRCNELGRRALAFLDEAEGPDNEHLDAALARVRSTPFETLLPEPAEPAKGYVVDRLAAFHPQRCAAVGEPALRRLCELGAERAGALGRQDPRSLALYCGVMLVAGSGFETDPLLPWGSTLLSDARARPRAEQARRLHSTLVALVTAMTGR